MSKEQIEKMAREMCHLSAECETCQICNERYHGDEDDLCYYQCIAKEIINNGYRKMPDNIGDFSDGYHTFNELYHHRAVLFSVICNMMPKKAWKSKLHDTGDMYDGMFIVGIETEQGQATYHYDIEPYWDMFKVKELEKAPKWDGHTPSDAIERIGNVSLEEYRKQSDVVPRTLYESLKNENIATIKAITDSQRAYAREIFEEIENRAYGFGACFVEMTRTTFDEIKKKYTEGEKNEN